MLLYHLSSVTFNVLSLLLSQAITLSTKLSNHTSVEAIYFSLLITLLCVQTVTQTILHCNILSFFVPEIVSWLALCLIVRIYKNHGPDHSFTRYVSDCKQTIYCHRYAAILMMLYFLIPKHHEIPISLHLFKSTMFLSSIIWCIFVSRIVNESTIKIKPHSIPCIAIQFILESLIFLVRLQKPRNHVLQFVRFPVSFEWTAHLLLYNMTTSILNVLEYLSVYLVVPQRVHFNHPLIIVIQQTANILVGYHLIFWFSWLTVLGPIPIITKLAVSVSIGHWVHFAVIGIHLFPRTFYIVHETKMAIEVIVNGFIWLSIFATINASQFYRNILTVSLAVIAITLRIQQCVQRSQVIEVIGEQQIESQIESEIHESADGNKELVLLNCSAFYDRETLCNLKVFEWIQMARISLHRSSYPVLLGFMMKDMPLEVIRIMVEYIDNFEYESVQRMQKHWISAQAHIDAIMSVFS